MYNIPKILLNRIPIKPCWFVVNVLIGSKRMQNWVIYRYLQYRGWWETVLGWCEARPVRTESWYTGRLLCRVSCGTPSFLLPSDLVTDVLLHLSSLLKLTQSPHCPSANCNLCEKSTRCSGEALTWPLLSLAVSEWQEQGSRAARLLETKLTRESSWLLGGKLQCVTETQLICPALTDIAVKVKQ